MIGTIQLETAISVSDYIGRAHGESLLAFDYASRAERDAILALKAELRGFLSCRKLRKLRFAKPTFIEFDSGNWTHAAAYFVVEITGPTEYLALAQSHFLPVAPFMLPQD